MRKLLAICATVALFSGDCVWGMSESQENLLQQSQQSGGQKIRKMASKGFQKAKNLFKRKKFQTQGTQTADSTSVEQISVHSQYFEENMDRLVKHGPDLYNLFHYEKMANSVANEGFSTPTEIVTYPEGNPKIWSDISEIRYANDVSCDKLENPKVILYRNKDNSCYIILRINGNKHGVFYGINESHIELGGKSFSVYDEYIGSFTDDVPRLIYVDESGLYFVTEAENPVEDVIKTYQSEGEFNFKGSIIKVSAIDGSITLDGNPLTKDNFFDNWVRENNKTVLSSRKPESKEVLRNLYPSSGYAEIYAIEGTEKDRIWLNMFSTESRSYLSYSGGQRSTPAGRRWLNFFVKRHFPLTKARSKKGAEELVRDGTFSLVLSKDCNFYSQRFFDDVSAQVVNKGGFSFGGSVSNRLISQMISNNLSLFKDPEFVRSLKPSFAELEKDYEGSRIAGFEEWLPFEIVRNL